LHPRPVGNARPHHTVPRDQARIARPTRACPKGP
jgi:hypothetical protein